MLAVLSSEEVKWYRSLTKSKGKKSAKDLERSILATWRRLKLTVKIICNMISEYFETMLRILQSQMVEAAKAGDLKEVLAKQFKQTRLGDDDCAILKVWGGLRSICRTAVPQGAVMVGVFGMPPVPVFPGYTSIFA